MNKIRIESNKRTADCRLICLGTNNDTVPILNISILFTINYIHLILTFYKYSMSHWSKQFTPEFFIARLQKERPPKKAEMKTDKNINFLIYCYFLGFSPLK